MELVKSPLNYTGGKFKLLPQLLPLFPEQINVFVDAMAGGCNVGVNVKSNKVIFNDPLVQIMDLMETMYKCDLDYMIEEIEFYEKEFGLSKENKDGYIALRKSYNESLDKNSIMLFTLITQSFSNQIRFNKSGEFNLPFGKRYFNPKLKQNFIGYVSKLHMIDAIFKRGSFSDVLDYGLSENDFVYFDPPYLITNATYNENGGWTIEDEYELYKTMDALNDRCIKFALSNVFENNGMVNDHLIEWSKKYNVHFLNNDYSNCNYQKKNRDKKTIEVCVTNY